MFSDFAFVITPRIRSMAQNRLTAVGRVAAITLHMKLKSNSRSATEVPTDWLAPRANPMAAETPMAGAPRTTIFLIASATSSYERSVRYFSSFGSRRWSNMRTPSLVHSMVLIMIDCFTAVWIASGILLDALTHGKVKREKPLLEAR